MSLPRLVIATHNRHKAEEMVTILASRFPKLQLLTLADFSGAPEPEETGSSYAENAAIKAESAARFTGEWCLADDAGLEVAAMGGEPGLYSRRFAGEETPFTEKMRRILDQLADVPTEGRGARFVCWVALARPGSPTELFSATCEGRIADAPSGNGGFGYDPIFWLPALECTMADLTPNQKHAVSHRGKVLAKVGEFLAPHFARENEASVTTDFAATA
ncbi:MAG: RdgB/HAM1 family non-canonical purine NTP pyrophosphatase [Fimbriimonadaceae bacterium]|nr:RdgB/HAM1 family non-canonical purine NTP pyrophosphatase [Fimbriimonadaceae bacterium]